MSNKYNKRFSLSILLWMRKDKPRQEGMNYWSGGHAQIIAASPGLLEYRQQHLSESEHSFWPQAEGLETSIPEDRRVDGIAEVTYQTLFAPLGGTKQTGLAFKDEINVFRRTLMHMGFPFSSRWYYTENPTETQLRDVIFFRRKEGVGSGEFKKFINDVLADQLSTIPGITELRTQVYLPWNKLTWNTPNVSHDNPKEEHLHASIMLGFKDEAARNDFYANVAPKFNDKITAYASAVHAYHMDKTLPYVLDGKRL